MHMDGGFWSGKMGSAAILVALSVSKRRSG